MRSVRKMGVLGLALALTASLAAGVSGCAGEATETQPTVTPSDEQTEQSRQDEPTPDVEEIEVRVRDGRPVPELGRVDVPVGSTVRLTVTSDTADEVHVHSYDEEITLRAGEPASVEFTADVPGLFEVELHESDTVLFSLQVS